MKADNFLFVIFFRLHCFSRYLIFMIHTWGISLKEISVRLKYWRTQEMTPFLNGFSFAFEWHRIWYIVKFRSLFFIDLVYFYFLLYNWRWLIFLLFKIWSLYHSDIFKSTKCHRFIFAFTSFKVNKCLWTLALMKG